MDEKLGKTRLMPLQYHNLPNPNPRAFLAFFFGVESICFSSLQLTPSASLCVSRA
jgi:hypothetical protein